MTVIIMVMIIVIVVIMFVMIMAFVVIMIIMFVVIMAFVVIMIIMFVVIMAFVIIMIIVVVMIIVVIMDMHFSVKVFSLSPNQSRANGSFDRERAAIAEAPLKNATKHAINGVMLGFTIKVDIKTTMPLDGDDGREVKLAGFKSLSATTMGAVGESRRTRRERKG